jgi:hypothetical protein
MQTAAHISQTEIPGRAGQISIVSDCRIRAAFADAKRQFPGIAASFAASALFIFISYV